MDAAARATLRGRCLALLGPLERLRRLVALPERAGFELAWFALGGLQGIAYLTYVPSSAILAIMPRWSFVAWAVVLLAGTLAGFYGVYAYRLPTRRYWPLVAERAALGLHCAAVSTLGIATIYAWHRVHVASGTSFPVITITLIVVWMLANLRRIVHITWEIKAILDVRIDKIDPYGDEYDMESDKG